MVDCKYWPPNFVVANNTASSGPREWFFIFDMPYSETPDSRLTQNILGSTMPIMWFGTPARNGNIVLCGMERAGSSGLSPVVSIFTGSSLVNYRPPKNFCCCDNRNGDHFRQDRGRRHTTAFLFQPSQIPLASQSQLG